MILALLALLLSQPAIGEEYQSDLLGKNNWDTIQQMLDQLPPPEPTPEPTDEPEHRGYEVDSNGRAYVIRIDKRVIDGVVVWRCWQQYLDQPEPVWNYVPPAPRKHRRHGRRLRTQN